MSERSKAFQYNHFGGEKSIFCYLHLQFNNSVGGNTMEKLPFGALPSVPPAGIWLVDNFLRKPVTTYIPIQLSSLLYCKVKL